jgi:hypothetical protein
LKNMCLGLVLLVSAVLVTSAAAQDAAKPAGPSVPMIVTVEAKHGANVPEITQQDVMVFEGRERDKVTDWIPLRGDHAALELFILIDDAANTSLGSQLEDIRQFITAQPATTRIGIGYMQNGMAQVVQNLTSDHALAAKALRLPLGEAGANASPYFSLGDLIKRWPDSNDRHEVLVVSDGIDRFWDNGPDDPYVSTVIEQAQKTRTVVFAIYTPGEGHYGHSYWRVNWGQLYLSRIAAETGGESYYIGFYGSAVSFVPYLDDLTQRLTRQYLLAFIPKPQKKAGMQNVKLMTEVPNAELVSADHVFVPASE